MDRHHSVKSDGEGQKTQPQTFFPDVTGVCLAFLLVVVERFFYPASFRFGKLS
jgi:hypothetical protein